MRMIEQAPLACAKAPRISAPGEALLTIIGR